ncbi:YdcF family protein [uncultured Nostoc sp.]|uniref:YdcF family protein n=1 Tax=uncultured Nostoc sp. TaxID=340711 RepID=UPI00263452F9|nr:YdcF family protein [uncultured Nostoc sp.]
MRWKSKTIYRAALWLVIPILLTIPVSLLAINIVPLFFCQAPLVNSKRKTFDVIIVLGNPANSDGSIGEIARQRVLKAVSLLHTRRAKYILFSGAAVYNHYVEADVMANFAHSIGVPRSSLVTDTEARNTYQNLFNATKIMLKNHWSSALIVTSPYHVRRTAFIVSHIGGIDYQVVKCEVPVTAWIEQLLIGQWENYLLTRLAFGGYSKSYGLTQEQMLRPSKEVMR